MAIRYLKTLREDKEKTKNKIYNRNTVIQTVILTLYIIEKPL